MRTLGISAFSRGSAAALVCDGAPLAAMAEERFTRERGHARFPERAIRACLRRGELCAAELDSVVFFEKPLRRFERVLACELASFPRSLSSFPRVLAHWLGERLWIKGRVVDELGIEAERVLFTTHHQAHAASAFFASAFEEAAVLVVDGGGEWTTTSLWHGQGTALTPLEEIHFPHSLVDLAQSFGALLGFGPHDALEALDELAAHGSPRRAGEIAAFLGLCVDGSFELERADLSLGSEARGGFAQVLEARFGPARAPGSPLASGGESAGHADLAASLWRALGDALLGLARRARERTGCERLGLAGDLAACPSLVDRLAREGGFCELFVPPAPGDSGAALGAALFVQHAVHGLPRGWVQEHACLGEEPGGGPKSEAASPSGPAESAAIARLLADGKCAGRVRGGFELGELALGQRCALADPRGSGGRERLVQGLRRDESFRTPALAIQEEALDELVDLAPAARAPARFQRVVAGLRAPWRERLAGAARPDGRCRVQSVSSRVQPDFHELLARFGELSGAPALLIVPLAQRGEPAVRTADEALAVLERSQLDALDLNGRLYLR